MSGEIVSTSGERKRKKMALPDAIMQAARDGDGDRVFAWLDAHEAAAPRTVNAYHVGQGVTMLMAIACGRADASHDSETSCLQLARELVRRGADVNLSANSVDIGPFELAFASLDRPGSSDIRGEFVRDFVSLLIDSGLEIDDSAFFVPIGAFIGGHSSRCLAEMCFALVRADAPRLDSAVRQFIRQQTILSAFAQDEHWLTCRALAEGVKAAGGEQEQQQHAGCFPERTSNSVALC